ncbi:MAG: GTPase ObgE [Rhizobacter sp.]|nr:GTPase ObgE [Ferruginibacter sp.]
MKFIDEVTVTVSSGHGGAGAVSFRRESMAPRGGPDGGDGGKGGDVILRASKHLNSLVDIRNNKKYPAPHGQPGAGAQCSGQNGEDFVLVVPEGTLVKNMDGEVLVDMTGIEKYVLLKGGRGGKGNAFFKTATNQAPEHAQPGEDGIEGIKILELKVLADVGLVGFPNAGKSTLLSSVTAARPKIADYAFTTLTPQLGMVEYRDGKSFCIADLPGIIEGAAEGKGLGHRFLRHIERNSILLFLIPADSADHKKEFEILRSELEQYNPDMLQKDFVIAISKSDMLDDELKEAIVKELPKKIPHIFISSITTRGLTELKDLLWDTLNVPPAAAI